MTLLRNAGSLLALLLATMLMGQANGCPDINSLLPQLDKMFGAKSGTKIYISNLSFLDVDSRSVMLAGDAELINQAVEDGMKMLAQQDPKYVINEAGRRIENNDANAQKLSTIFWDANLPRTEKVDKIISEMMEPVKVDGLVFGQYQQGKDEITVRPAVIAKASKNLISQMRKFTAQEYNCTDPNNPQRKVLCQKAKEEIRDIVIALLKQL